MCLIRSRGTSPSASTHLLEEWRMCIEYFKKGLCFKAGSKWWLYRNKTDSFKAEFPRTLENKRHKDKIESTTVQSHWQTLNWHFIHPVGKPELVRRRLTIAWRHRSGPKRKNSDICTFLGSLNNPATPMLICGPFRRARPSGWKPLNNSTKSKTEKVPPSASRYQLEEHCFSHITQKRSRSLPPQRASVSIKQWYLISIHYRPIPQAQVSLWHPE